MWVFFMSFFVYIIYSASLDKLCRLHFRPRKRLLEHNGGISEYTSKASDWLLKFSESYSTRDLAMKGENVIKIWKYCFACPDSHGKKVIPNHFGITSTKAKGHPESFRDNLHKKQKVILNAFGITSTKLKAHIHCGSFLFQLPLTVELIQPTSEIF